jgi:hypothetical protein
MARTYTFDRWQESFAYLGSTKPAPTDVGTGANRKIIALAGYWGLGGGIHPVPGAFTMGSDNIPASGSAYSDPSTSDLTQLYIGDLTVTGNQTPTIDYVDGPLGSGSGASYCAYVIIKGDAALTIANVLALLAQATGGGGGNLSRTVTSALGSDVVAIGISQTAGPTATSPATMISSGAGAGYAMKRDSLASSTPIAGDWGAFGGWISTAFTVTEAPASPVLTGNITTDDAVASGTLAPTPPSSLTGNITADDAVASGTLGAAPGTVTIGPIKNSAGDVLPSTTIPIITFLRASDGLQVLTLTNQVTSSSPTAPMLAVTHASLVQGVKYAVASWDGTFANSGIEPATAT